MKKIDQINDPYEEIFELSYNNPYKKFPFLVLLGSKKLKIPVVGLFKKYYFNKIKKIDGLGNRTEILLDNGRTIIFTDVEEKEYILNLQIYDYYPQDLQYFNMKEDLDKNAIKNKNLYFKLKAKQQ